jgi:hypothetical protein
MIHTLLVSLTLSLALFFTGCASPGDHKQGARPDWVDGSSSRYPREQYILGRGQADQLATAQDYARGNIAKTFQVNIHESSSDSQQLKQSTDESGSRSTLDTRISRDINTETDQIIAGIEIADVWQDPETGDYYTLGILSRRQALARLRQQIEQLDNATGKFISASRDTNDTLSRAGFAAQAFSTQQQRAAFQKMATVIDLNGHGITPRWEPARLEADLNELLGRMRIQPVSTGTGQTGQTMTALLAGALAAAGMTPADENNSDYQLKGQLEISDLGQHDGWQWQRGSVQIQLNDKTSGQLRGKHSWINLKAAGLDSATANQRLIDKIDQALKQDMRQTLLDMATP